MRQWQTEWGPICYEERGAGPAVLLIHSFPHDHRVWQKQADELSNQFRVITPDLPGFGQSARMTGFSVESVATLLLSMIDALNLPRVVIGGISMGGYISLAMAKRQNPKVVGLILADTKAAADTPEARQKRSDLIDLVRNDGASHVIRQMLPLQLTPTVAVDRPQALHLLQNVMAAQTSQALIAGMTALRDRADYSDVLPHVDIPTLLLFGQNDQITPPETADLLARSLRSSTIRLIPNCGHISSIEQPASVTAALREFLRSIPPG